MPSTSRGMILSLLTLVVALLLAVGALLGVSQSRRQRLEDVTADFQRSMKQQQGQINTLRKLLEDCDTLRATSTDTLPGRVSVF